MTAVPRRVQRRRTKGARLPENTVAVTRPSRFGNPFTLALAVELGYARRDEPEKARAAAVDAFAAWLGGNRDMWQSDDGDRARERILDGLPSLRGKSLACYCPADSAHCHADVLLRLAARGPAEFEKWAAGVRERVDRARVARGEQPLAAVSGELLEARR